MDFNFNIPINVISGRDCLEKNSEKLTAFGKSCLIVTGGTGARKSGAFYDCIVALEKCGINFRTYEKITANPLISSCHEAGRLAEETNADFIIGIGGGSALDAAKAVAVYATNPDFSPEDIYTKPRKSPLPIILIGTTAGTGSEVGKVSVLTNDATGRKKSISGDDLYPALTFADPKYTESLPIDYTISTGLDALCHALEGYFTSKCTDIPTVFAEKAVSLIWDELYNTQIYAIPHKMLNREKLYYGSLYAGIILAYCGTAFPHPLGYVLTENYGVPHGFACAAFLPEYLRRCAEYEPEKTEKILEIADEDLDSFCEKINELTSLPNIEMTQEELDKYCSRWDDAIPNNFKFTPGGFTKEEAKTVLSKFVK